MATVRLTREQCDNDDLPTICAKCGHEDTRPISRTFTWCPSWVFIFIFLGGLLPLLIAYLLARKKMPARIPMCDRHARDWARASVFGWVSVLVFVGLPVGLALEFASDANGIVPLIVGCVGILVTLIAIAIWNSFLVRPTNISKEDITLTGVCREFADEAKAMRSRRGYDDDDDDRPRRKKYNEYDDDLPRRSGGRNRYDDDDDRRRDRD